MPESARNVESPCVRNCCLDENDVCLGCHRTLQEICGWSTSSEAVKREILAKCRVRSEERRKKRTPPSQPSPDKGGGV
jgi:predicted Fe-S protein YdhL (DUF1289 family)